MVNPRQKGIRGEQQVIAILDRETKEKWEQTPGSGSGKIKGDLRVNGKHNIFCVEVKFYKHVGPVIVLPSLRSSRDSPR